EIWLNANMKAIETFPEVTFLPGFWSEYGEINEPSAFGSKLLWLKENLPHAETIISTVEEIEKLEKPNVETDGLLPLMINRLKSMEPKINAAGHHIRFAIARGPFNIACFLMGTTEFMLAMMTNPAEIHQLLRIITDFTIDWLKYQKQCIPSIEGIMILDDLIGFVGEPECTDFAAPYLKEMYKAFDAQVNFFHNDADGLVVAEHMEEIGVNLFNFSFKHSMPEMRKACGDKVVLLGNIPPRDVMAVGNVEDVKKSVQENMDSIEDHQRIMWSLGGGVPQGVPSENVSEFIKVVYDYYK
ncbi:uroporphyrinogen decarboxylase family protein, partial [Bacteroidota bacterium]